MTTYTPVTPDGTDDTVSDLAADILAGISGIYDVTESTEDSMPIISSDGRLFKIRLMEITEDTEAANAALFDWAAAQPDPNPEPLAR